MKWTYDLPNFRRKREKFYQINFMNYWIHYTKKEYFIELVRQIKINKAKKKKIDEEYNKAIKYLTSERIGKF